MLLKTALVEFEILVDVDCLECNVGLHMVDFESRKSVPLAFLSWAVLAFCGTSLLKADEFSSNAVKIHYFVMGKGDPVILVHGLYSSAAMNWCFGKNEVE